MGDPKVKNYNISRAEKGRAVLGGALHSQRVCGRVFDAKSSRDSPTTTWKQKIKTLAGQFVGAGPLELPQSRHSQGDFIDV